MKTLFTSAVLAVLIAAGTTVKAQDWPEEYLGLPGDNLNLYAVMDLFQKSETLEGFERVLNAEDTRINNLDLNGDNLVDYIMVNDYVDGKVHNIVLRVALDRYETQDVAVFTVVKHRNGSVEIQLVGDKALYGKDYIIEPNYARRKSTPNPGYTGSEGYDARVAVVTVSAWDIAGWPLVRWMYLPEYVAWRTGWYWGYWPANWYAWRPWYWHYYYGFHYNWYDHYYAHYRLWHHYRYPRYHDYYYVKIRSYSPKVNEKIHGGYYKDTYSRPELRKEGEAYYATVNPGKNSRVRDNNSASATSRVRSSEGTRTDERSGSAAAAPERRTRSSAEGRSAGNAAESNPQVITTRDMGATRETKAAEVFRRNSSGTSRSSRINSGDQDRGIVIPSHPDMNGTSGSRPSGNHSSRTPQGTSGSVTGRSAPESRIATRPATTSPEVRQSAPVRQSTPARISTSSPSSGNRMGNSDSTPSRMSTPARSSSDASPARNSRR